MNRSGYSDDLDEQELNLWRGAVASAIRGKRGQALLKEMAAALDAMQAGTRMTLVRLKGTKPPPKFPRGELMCENHDGRNVYSYDPAKVIAWLNAHRLVAIEIK